MAEFTCNNEESWGSWKIKTEKPCDYSKSADVRIENNYWKNDQISGISNAPSISGPIYIHKTVYLNGCGWSGKTICVIELFRGKSNMIGLKPTHSLARERKQREINACS